MALRARRLLARIVQELGQLYAWRWRIDSLIEDGYASSDDLVVVIPAIAWCHEMLKDQQSLIRAMNGLN
jgi:hypothetical protein